MDILISLLDTSVYSVCDSEDLYHLDQTYVKPNYKVFATHCLKAYRQNPGKPLKDFLQRLKSLSKNCNFVNFIPAQIQEAAIRDLFISSLESNCIRNIFQKTLC